MPNVFVYRSAISPRIVKQENGKYALIGIPIFECHDREDIHCDEKWMNACIKDQQENKKGGFLPRLIVGHNSEHPQASEKPASAFLDNYRYDADDKWLYADYVDVSEELLAEIKDNKWPGRSVEASREKPAINAVALLGGTPPYFKLPDIKYGADGSKTVSILTEVHMATQSKNDKEMRKLYAEFINKYNMPTGGESDAMEADYKRFCEMYERLQKELADKKSAELDSADENADEQYAEEEAKKKAEAEKASETAKMSAREAGEQTVKYSDTPEYKTMLARLDKLEEEKNALLETNEKAKWSQKYSALHIPAGRIDVDKEVETIMEFPESKRQLYFDKTTTAIVTPAVEPVKYDAAAIANARPGSEEESIAIRQLYQENKEKYRGDFGAAQRDFRAGVRSSVKK